MHKTAKMEFIILAIVLLLLLNSGCNNAIMATQSQVITEPSTTIVPTWGPYIKHDVDMEYNDCRACHSIGSVALFRADHEGRSNLLSMWFQLLLLNQVKPELII